MNTAFAVLERCAAAGERCPINETQNINSTVVSALARVGRIKVEVSGRNWRTVTILKGPHAGKTTKPDPNSGHVYQTIGITTEWTPRHVSQISRSDAARRRA